MAQAMKIAIVDDEQDMRQSISQWLALSGYDTETFSSAEEALKVLGPDYPGHRDFRHQDAGHGRDAVPEKADGQRQRAAGDHDHRPR